METSILVSTKKILGVGQGYDAFDTDIITHINAAFSIVNQLGVGPPETFSIEDENAEWEELDLPSDQLGLIKPYIFLRVKMLFDPPTTSYLLNATNEQLAEYETRLSISREQTVPTPQSTTQLREAHFEEEVNNGDRGDGLITVESIGF